MIERFRRARRANAEPVRASAEAENTSATTFLDPATLARISDLELLARTVVDGFINGLHRTPHLGVSLDFAEHRLYMPGDDTRRIDWRLYARTDRFYLKEFEADTVMNFSILLDVSSSMRYGSGAITKFDYARFLAACLAYFAHGQRDRVGLVTFDADIVEVVPPSTKHLPALLHAIARAKAVRPGNLHAPLSKLAEHFRRRSMVLLISDLYAKPDDVVDAVRHIRQNGNDVMVVHILDPAELDFPFDEAAPFEDLETGDKLSVVPSYLRDQYKTLVQTHIAELEARLGSQGVDYSMFNTSQPLDYALFDFLSKRQQRIRAHS
ncbi:MAG TPA: DUF58 domain-containing protein [Gemmatimonadaceae bacterium]|nr:DUF58 domain-containing protein [Gemmatimonadaceae bacterium]